MCCASIPVILWIGSFSSSSCANLARGHTCDSLEWLRRCGLYRASWVPAVLRQSQAAEIWPKCLFALWQKFPRSAFSFRLRNVFIRRLFSVMHCFLRANQIGMRQWAWGLRMPCLEKKGVEWMPVMPAMTWFLCSFTQSWELDWIVHDLIQACFPLRLT